MRGTKESPAPYTEHHPDVYINLDPPNFSLPTTFNNKATFPSVCHVSASLFCHSNSAHSILDLKNDSVFLLSWQKPSMYVQQTCSFTKVFNRQTDWELSLVQQRQILLSGTWQTFGLNCKVEGKTAKLIVADSSTWYLFY